MSLARAATINLERVREISLTALLTLQGLLIFAAAPLLSLSKHLTEITAVLLGVGFIVSAAVVSRSKTAMSLMLGCALAALIGTVTRNSHPSPVTDWLGHGAALLALGTLSVVVGRAVFGPGEVTAHRVRGAIVLYLNVALMFTGAYRLIAELAPDAFTLPKTDTDATAPGTMLYFSLTTLTSTGYGDILPVHPFARSLANLEAIVGQLFPATLLARIVTLHIEARRH